MVNYSLMVDPVLFHGWRNNSATGRLVCDVKQVNASFRMSYCSTNEYFMVERYCGCRVDLPIHLKPIYFKPIHLKLIYLGIRQRERVIVLIPVQRCRYKPLVVTYRRVIRVIDVKLGFRRCVFCLG